MSESEISVSDALEVLSLGEQFGLDELKSRYRVVALRVHPDRGGSAELFQTVLDCYRVLEGAFHARTGAKGHAALKADFEHQLGRLDGGVPAPESLRGPDFQRRFQETFERFRARDASQEEGYGDWLSKCEEGAQIQRSRVTDSSSFNSEFERIVPAAKEEKSLVVHPMTLAQPGISFTELGVSQVDDYEISCSDKLVAYDCKKAFTSERVSHDGSMRSAAPVREFDVDEISKQRARSLEVGMTEAELNARLQESENRLRMEKARAAYQAQVDRASGKLFHQANRFMLHGAAPPQSSR